MALILSSHRSPNRELNMLLPAHLEGLPVAIFLIRPLDSSPVCCPLDAGGGTAGQDSLTWDNFPSSSENLLHQRVPCMCVRARVCVNDALSLTPPTSPAPKRPTPCQEVKRLIVCTQTVCVGAARTPSRVCEKRIDYLSRFGSPPGGAAVCSQRLSRELRKGTQIRVSQGC